MEQEYTIAAYVWPAYHNEPRWQPFFKGTDGEWEIIRNAKPQFPGHYQPRVPLWGYESESDPRVMAKKINAAADHGVNTFIFDWYWYDGKPFLEDTLNKGFLAAPNNNRMSFYLMWANHDATSGWDYERADENVLIWPGKADMPTFEVIVDRVITRYMKHPRYHLIDGKPVFSIYDPTSLINGFGGLDQTRQALDYFRREAVDAGFAGLHIQSIPGLIPGNPPAGQPDGEANRANTVQRLGLDSLTSYQWCHHTAPRGEYVDWAAQSMVREESLRHEYPVGQGSAAFFPHVSVGWDTSPRFKKPRQDIVVNQSPKAFEGCLRWAKAWVERDNIRPKLVTLNSWNEWGEGSHLEPDRKFGMGFLEAVRDVFRK